MRATEIAVLLAQDAENVCRRLLPDGKRRKREWIVGDVDGSAGESLSVCVEGSKAGVWADFATGESGDLVGLWMATQRIGLREACVEAMQYLGIRDEARLEPPPRKFERPTRDGVTKLPPQIAEWLRTVRKIGPEAIEAYKLAAQKGVLMFPYLRDGELIAAKFRAVPEKKFWASANTEPCLFGWQAIPPDARSVVIVEGELDALASWQYGVPALSVPFGGGQGDKQQWIECEFDRLAIYDDIILALDDDKAGQQAVAEIVKRLGRERCRVATLPRKDANQCLIDGVSAEEYRAAIDGARSLDPENLKSAADYEDAVAREFAALSAGDEAAGIKLPWKFAHRLRLRAGETSIWAGMNGHGKSQLIGAVTVSALRDGCRCCVASLEFVPPKFLRRMQCQHLGERLPGEAKSRMLSREWRGKLWVFDPGTKGKADRLLETMAYAVKRYGIELFVIDNLAKLGIAEDDYSGQAGFVDRLTDFSRSYNTHCALVHHVKKTDKGENAPPEKGDVKGSGGITDLVDTVLTVWRNKPKENKVRLNGGRTTPELEREPDCILTCHKQRNGDDEPLVKLWFEPASYRYFDHAPTVAPVAEPTQHWSDQ